MPDYKALTVALFDLIWDEVSDGGDLDSDYAITALLELGLVEERVCDPASNEYGVDKMYYPTAVVVEEEDVE